MSETTRYQRNNEVILNRVKEYYKNNNKVYVLIKCKKTYA